MSLKTTSAVAHILADRVWSVKRTARKDEEVSFFNWPRPERIEAADICRDGGTYIMSYLAGGQSHEVELPVLTDANGDRIGYKSPTIDSGSGKSPLQLSWEDAAQLAEQLSPLVEDGIGWGGKEKAAAMIRFLSLMGRLK